MCFYRDFVVILQASGKLPEAFDMAIEALTNTSNTLNTLDCISRQAAIDEAYSIVIDGEKYDVVQVETLMGLPSAQQKPLKYTGDSICLYCQTTNCDGCMYEPMEGVQ